MPSYNLCILGFGNVGRALVRHLQRKTEELHERYAITWRLTGVASRRLGWMADPAGLDASLLLSGHFPPPSPARKVDEWLQLAQAEVLFELTSTDTWTSLPAIDHLRTALEHGVHAITANKGALVHAYEDLQALAQARGKRFLFEATVMGGVPVFSLFQEALPATQVQRFRGLPNSTCNVMQERAFRGQERSFDKRFYKLARALTQVANVIVTDACRNNQAFREMQFDRFVLLGHNFTALSFDEIECVKPILCVVADSISEFEAMNSEEEVFDIANYVFLPSLTLSQQRWARAEMLPDPICPACCVDVGESVVEMHMA